VGTIFLQIYDFNPPSEQELQDRMALPLESEQAAPVEELEETTADESISDDEVTSEDDVITGEKVASKEEKAGPDPAPMEHTPSVVAQEEKIVVVEAVPEPEKASEPAYELAGEQALAREERALAEEPIALEMEAAPESKMEAAPEPERREKSRARAKKSTPVYEAAQQEELVMTAMAEGSMNQVSGIVIFAEDQEPLPGATVMLKDADTGVSTDMQGYFRLAVPADTLSTLVASFVGMQTEEYTVQEGSEVEILLETDASTMSEVVLVSGVTSDYLHETPRYRAAEPADGYRAYRRYVEKNLRHPDPATEDRQVVILTFNLTAEGEIGQFQTIRSPGPAFTAEAIRVITEGPSWIPAEIQSGPMDELVRIRIVFRK
jgi:hypothetical protein